MLGFVKNFLKIFLTFSQSFLTWIPTLATVIPPYLCFASQFIPHNVIVPCQGAKIGWKTVPRGALGTCAGRLSPPKA